MKYKIYFCNQPSTSHETINASNFKIKNNFVTFFIVISGIKINVASFPADKISKIEFISDDKHQSNIAREKKLKRILKKNNILKTIFKFLYKNRV